MTYPSSSSSLPAAVVGRIGNPLYGAVGKVATVAGTTVTVNVRGVLIPIEGFYGAYTPTVGDNVHLLLNGNSWVIADKIVGH